MAAAGTEEAIIITAVAGAVAAVSASASIRATTAATTTPMTITTIVPATAPIATTDITVTIATIGIGDDKRSPSISWGFFSVARLPLGRWVSALPAGKGTLPYNLLRELAPRLGTFVLGGSQCSCRMEHFPA